MAAGGDESGSGFAVHRTGVWRDPSLTLLVDLLTALDEGAPASARKASSLLLDRLIQRKVDALGAAAAAQLLETGSGSRFEVDARDRFASGLLAGRLVESADLNVFCSLIRPGDTVIDVGANFGLYAVEAGKRVGPDGKAFAFEPSRQYDYLARNIPANGLASVVEPARLAVSSSSGRRPFFEAASGSFSGFTDNRRGGTTQRIEVDTVALDAFPPLAGRTIDMMKIDVEGAEPEVLAGAGELLSRSPGAVLLIEANRKNLSDAASNALTAWLLDPAADRRVRAGFHAAEPGVELTSVADIEAVMSGNLFVARAGHESDRRLSDAIAAERRRPPAPDPQPSQLVQLGFALTELVRNEADAREAAEAELAALKDLARRLPLELKTAVHRADTATDRAARLEADLKAISVTFWWRLGRRLGIRPRS